jgi:hypothetical protein
MYNKQEKHIESYKEKSAKSHIKLKSIRKTADFSTETLKSRMAWKDAF